MESTLDHLPFPEELVHVSDRTRIIPFDAGTLFLLAAALLAAGIVWSAEPPLNLAHPRWLVPCALTLLWPTRLPIVRLWQSVTLACLGLIVLQATAEVVWKVDLPARDGVSLRISSSLAWLVLAAVGRMFRAGTFRVVNGSKRLDGLLAAMLVVLGVHAGLLWTLLQVTFGFGWESDGTVAGRVGLAVLGVVLFKPLNESYPARCGCGLVLAIFLAMRGGG